MIREVTTTEWVFCCYACNREEKTPTEEGRVALARDWFAMCAQSVFEYEEDEDQSWFMFCPACAPALCTFRRDKVGP